jgi:hypothetical protein
MCLRGVDQAIHRAGAARVSGGVPQAQTLSDSFTAGV